MKRRIILSTITLLFSVILQLCLRRVSSDPFSRTVSSTSDDKTDGVTSNDNNKPQTFLPTFINNIVMDNSEKSDKNSDSVIVKPTVIVSLVSDNLESSFKEDITVVPSSLLQDAVGRIHQNTLLPQLQPLMTDTPTEVDGNREPGISTNIVPNSQNINLPSQQPEVIFDSSYVEAMKEEDNVTTINQEQEKENERTEQHYIVRAEPKVISSTNDLTIDIENQKTEDGVSSKDVNNDTVTTIEVDLELINKKQTNDSDSVLNMETTTTTFVSPSSENAVSEEDIPSFSEWTQQQLQEAERRKGSNSSDGLNGSSKPLATSKNIKNYASPDCGAKIITTNTDSQNPSAVINPSKDEYMLNICSHPIMFVVELCEAIQAEKIEIANFELFSSSPKDIIISISDRYPTRDWRQVGTFRAEDERTVQNFTLEQNSMGLFGKYFKVEVISHYGSEHYCPISLFRVYGKSEIEVLEEDDQGQDDDDDETQDATGSTVTPRHNMFGTARDAVVNLVKKAAEALKGGDHTNTTSEDSKRDSSSTPMPTCSAPSYPFSCSNCSDVVKAKPFRFSCLPNQLQQQIDMASTAQLCSMTDDVTLFNPHRMFLQLVWGDDYVSELCGFITKQLVLPDATSELVTKETQLNTKMEHMNETETVNTVTTETVIDPSFSPEVIVTSIDEVPVELSESMDIVPTKIDKMETVATIVEARMMSSAEDLSVPLESSVVMDQSHSSIPINIDGSSVQWENVVVEDISEDQVQDAVLPTTPEMDSILLSEMEAEIPSTSIPLDPTSPLPLLNVPTTQTAQKESVFVRLSNKIKTLERNLSLSSQYLEELSRRYKKQMEEMQKTLNKTSATMEEASKSSMETQRLYRVDVNSLRVDIAKLSTIVETLLSEREELHSKVIGQHLSLMLVEVTVVSIILVVCLRRRGESRTEGTNVHQKKTNSKSGGKKLLTRRCSVEGVSGHHVANNIRPRRPSEEALNVAALYKTLTSADNQLADKKQFVLHDNKTVALLPDDFRRDSTTSSKSSSNAGNGGGKKRKKHKKDSGFKKSASAATLSLNGHVDTQDQSSRGVRQEDCATGSTSGRCTESELPFVNTKFNGYDGPSEWWGEVKDNSQTWHGPSVLNKPPCDNNAKQNPKMNSKKRVDKKSADGLKRIFNMLSDQKK